MNRPQTAWSDDIFSAFIDLDIRQVAYVPDAGHAKLIAACHADNRMRAVPLTSEEEGIGLAAGAWLGGQRAAVLMQSAGVGNCVNALAMIQACRFPLLAVVTMRGQWGESNPWHLPLGQTAAAVLRLAGVIVETAETAEDVGPTVAAAGRMAFNSSAAVAVLIAQRVIGAKSFGGEK